VEDMELSGSGVVESASDSFEIVSVNNVTWRDIELEALTEVERAVVDSEGGRIQGDDERDARERLSHRARLVSVHRQVDRAHGTIRR
jgi:hypothetical protein